MSSTKNDTAPAVSDEWETVAEESPSVVIFDTPGDVFEGTYIGTERIEPENDDPFTRFLFRQDDGTLCAINSSFKMEAGMGKVQAGQYTRVTFVKEIPSKKGNPMKDLKIQVRK